MRKAKRAKNYIVVLSPVRNAPRLVITQFRREYRGDRSVYVVWIQGGSLSLIDVPSFGVIAIMESKKNLTDPIGREAVG